MPPPIRQLRVAMLRLVILLEITGKQFPLPYTLRLDRCGGCGGLSISLGRWRRRRNLPLLDACCSRRGWDRAEDGRAALLEIVCLLSPTTRRHVE